MKQTTLDLANLSSDNPRIKYGTAKELIALSAKQPNLLYPNLDFFDKLLKSENNILKWTAIDIVGHLVPLTTERQQKAYVKKMIAFLQGGKLITAAHSISALAHIAKELPELRTTILTQLLKVEQYTYETIECRNIVIGKTLLALNNFTNELTKLKGASAFIERQTSNTRPATKKKAERLLRVLESQ
ncbi:MAG: hypothetical protein EPO24_09690 [Bacteroidetes bacterium]|nr:MAG: hypothetical protein EPO24_09690 [Bacteroidota bacterium]